MTCNTVAASSSFAVGLVHCHRGRGPRVILGQGWSGPGRQRGGARLKRGLNHQGFLHLARSPFSGKERRRCRQQGFDLVVGLADPWRGHVTAAAAGGVEPPLQAAGQGWTGRRLVLGGRETLPGGAAGLGKVENGGRFRPVLIRGPSFNGLGPITAVLNCRQR